MGVFVKRRDGVEYLYVLAGNSQYFLGRKDDLEGLNLQNLRKAASIIDKNFERTLSKYLTDMQERTKYMPEKEGREYTLGRLKKISLLLDQYVSTAKKSGLS